MENIIFENIFEKKYYEQVEKMKKEYEKKLQDHKEIINDDLCGLQTKIYNLLDKKIPDEDMDNILNWINEVGNKIEKRNL